MALIFMVILIGFALYGFGKAEKIDAGVEGLKHEM